jgi:hypothetical protein
MSGLISILLVRIRPIGVHEQDAFDFKFLIKLII